MKRGTKKVIFLTSMIMTFIAMMAFGGRHRFMHHGCGHGSEQDSMKNDCQRSNHHRHLFHWNDESNAPVKNKS